MQKIFTETDDSAAYLEHPPKSAILVAWEKGAELIYPTAKKLHQRGSQIDVILGFSDISHVKMECEFAAISERLYIMTQNGSFGAHATICEALGEMILDKPESEMLFFSCPDEMCAQIVKIAKSENFS